ncbi:hypothetical protein J4477_01405 [Candidatus Pacearchaeota archaeon]|nr:hypothetical protein [Candidatus Pacearchaeota archaeon]
MSLENLEQIYSEIQKYPKQRMTQDQGNELAEYLSEVNSKLSILEQTRLTKFLIDYFGPILPIRKKDIGIEKIIELSKGNRAN